MAQPAPDVGVLIQEIIDSDNEECLVCLLTSVVEREHTKWRVCSLRWLCAHMVALMRWVPIRILSFALKLKTYDNLTQPFDSDSVELKIDNCCSRTLSGHKGDFIKSTLEPVTNMVVEAKSLDYVTHEGTIKRTILDDKGQRCNPVIPKSLYVPSNGN
jgi:hypothetical protein